MALEDESDVLAQLDRTAPVQGRDVPIQDDQPALLNPPEGTDQGEEGRLPRSGRTGHDHHLAATDLDRIIEEDLGARLPLPDTSS